MSGYAEQPWEDHGKFQCQGCLFTFDRAHPGHGASGYCCQCEIAMGMVLLFDNPEENAREQVRTRAAIARSMIVHMLK